MYVSKIHPPTTPSSHPLLLLPPRRRPAQHQDAKADASDLHRILHEPYGPLPCAHRPVDGFAALAGDVPGEADGGGVDGEEHVRVERTIGPAEEGAVCVRVCVRVCVCVVWWVGRSGGRVVVDRSGHKGRSGSPNNV